MRAKSVAWAFLVLLPAGCAVFAPAEMEKCLPGGITMATRFSLEYYPRDPITVKRRLFQLGAYCQNGKIFDRWGKEIYFYQVPETGGVAPPPIIVTDENGARWQLDDRVNNSHEEEDRLKSLEQHYRVIKMYAPDLPCSAASCQSALAN